MVKEVTLFTVRGLKARILRTLVGIPLLVVGGWMLYAGLGNPTALENVLLLVFGAGLGFLGVYNCLGAVRGDDVPIQLRFGSSGRE